MSKAVVHQPTQPLTKKEASPIEAALDEVCPPSYWSNGRRNLDARAGLQAQVSPPAEVCEEIQRMLDRTFKLVRTRDRAQGVMPKRLHVVQVLRIENSTTWNRYAEERCRIRRKGESRCTPVSAISGEFLTKASMVGLGSDLSTNLNEAYLFHGTAAAAATSIASDGFKVKLAGSSAGTMYGNGVYLSECSSKGDEYAKPDDEGHCCLLLCRVILGEMLHMTRGGVATHTMIAEAMRSEEYDSVLGDREACRGTYREFVVYKDEKVYPEYVIVYSRQY